MFHEILKPVAEKPLGVRHRADCVLTLRWLCVDTMRTLAGWTPVTPEMEAKLLLGKHTYDMAQFADTLGKRGHEMRMPLQASREPCTAFGCALREAKGAASCTAQRLRLVYGEILPFVHEFVDWYRAEVDQLLDEPTLRLFDHFELDAARMLAEAREVVEFLKANAAQLGMTDLDVELLHRTFEPLGALTLQDFVDFREALGESPGAAGDD